MAGAKPVHVRSLQRERKFDGAARILALKLVELPLPRQHPQRVGERRLQAGFHSHRGGLGLEPGRAEIDRLLLGEVNEGSGRFGEFVFHFVPLQLSDMGWTKCLG